MGIILCKKHGLQGFKEVCEHIYQEYENDIYNKNREFELGEIYLIEVCDKCWQKHNLDKFKHFAEISSDEFLDMDDERAKVMEDEWSKVYNSVNRRVLCLQCVSEVKVKQARRNNEPLPFPIFEKTLMFRDKDKIDEIENRLISTLQIEKYILNPQPHYKSENCLSGHKTPPSVCIHAGAFRSPLLISIHSVSSEDRQNEIIEFVKRIFDDEENKQVKIEFHDEDNWVFHENLGEVLHSKNRQGNILREVYLNC